MHRLIRAIPGFTCEKTHFTMHSSYLIAFKEQTRSTVPGWRLWLKGRSFASGIGERWGYTFPKYYHWSIYIPVLGRIFTIFSKRNNFYDLPSASPSTSIIRKGVHSKSNEFGPKKHFFLFKVDPIKRRQINFWWSYLPCKSFHFLPSCT